MNKKNVVCYGEVLWDVFPSHAKPGGAPMNVAYHLHQMGIQANIISKLAYDKRGTELTSIIKQWGLSTNFIQYDNTYPTSEVIATMDNLNEMSYEITYPVAWDFIQWQNNFEDLILNADAFIFGSLATRNDTSYKTLLKCLELAPYKVFDVNLRQPFYTKDIIFTLLKKTHLLKVNQAEFNLVADWINPNCSTEDQKVDIILKNFGISEIIVTKGRNGASYFNSDAAHYDQHAFPVIVVDTVGSGDAFLGALLASKFNGSSIKEQLENASMLGSFVATQEGACPDYNILKLHSFKKNYE